MSHQFDTLGSDTYTAYVLPLLLGNQSPRFLQPEDCSSLTGWTLALCKVVKEEAWLTQCDHPNVLTIQWEVTTGSHQSHQTVTLRRGLYNQPPSEAIGHHPFAQSEIVPALTPGCDGHNYG